MSTRTIAINLVATTALLLAPDKSTTPSAAERPQKDTSANTASGGILLTAGQGTNEQFTDEVTPEPLEAPQPSSTSTSVVEPVLNVRDLFCLGTNWTESCDPEEVEPAEPVLTLGMVTTAFRRVPIPATPLVIEPVDGVTLVNLPTNFHTPAEPFTRTVTLLGRQIRLDITPVSWAWSFGDGTTVTTDSPGAPYPDLEVTHAYLRAGRVAPSVATTYTATFSVDGGPSQPVPGSVTIDSPPAALEVRTATARLSDPTR